MNTSDDGTITDKQENNNSLVIFLPSPRLKLIYLTYLFFGVWVFIMPCLMAISVMYPPSASLPVSVAALLVVLLALTWTRKYYSSISYHFTAGQITRYNGVLLKRKTCISCDQVHRISARRGPFQRLFGFATVDLLTSDPTVSSGSRILMSINGVEKPDALEEMIDSCRAGKSGNN
ncbi:MAG: PH domain-containing protein [Methanomicrobiales archaeon]